MAKLTRRCYTCLVTKELEQFPKHKGKPLGMGYVCKPCAVQRAQAQYTKEDLAQMQRKVWLKRKYGLTPERWEEMYTEQGGGCLICTNTEDLVVDHNHDTGEVRGLLCRKCNSGLGMFKDNDLLLIAAGRYLSSLN